MMLGAECHYQSGSSFPFVDDAQLWCRGVADNRRRSVSHTEEHAPALIHPAFPCTQTGVQRFFSEPGAFETRASSCLLTTSCPTLPNSRTPLTFGVSLRRM